MPAAYHAPGPAARRPAAPRCDPGGLPRRAARRWPRLLERLDGGCRGVLPREARRAAQLPPVSGRPECSPGTGGPPEIWTGAIHSNPIPGSAATVMYHETWPHEARGSSTRMDSGSCSRPSASASPAARVLSAVLVVVQEEAPAPLDARDTVLNRALLYRDRRDFVIRAGDTGKWDRVALQS